MKADNCFCTEHSPWEENNCWQKRNRRFRNSALYFMLICSLCLFPACTQAKQSEPVLAAEADNGQTGGGVQSTDFIRIESGDAYCRLLEPPNTYSLDIRNVFDWYDQRYEYSQGDTHTPGGSYFAGVGGDFVDTFAFCFKPDGEIMQIKATVYPMYPITEGTGIVRLTLNGTTLVGSDQPVDPRQAYTDESSSDIVGYYVSYDSRISITEGPDHPDFSDRGTFAPFEEISSFLADADLEALITEYGVSNAIRYKMSLVSLRRDELEESGIQVIYLDCKDMSSIVQMSNDDVEEAIGGLYSGVRLGFRNRNYLTLFEYVPFTDGMSEYKHIKYGNSNGGIEAHYAVNRIIVFLL